MAIGTTAALLGGLAASAGTSLAGAKMQSSAAKKAAETQAKSANEAMRIQGELAKQAMGLQGQMWGGIQNMYSPYTASAPATLSALHEFVGIPGARQAQTMVPYGAYGPPMRQPFLGQPGAGGPPMFRPPGPGFPPGGGFPPELPPRVPGPMFGSGVGPYAASMSPMSRLYAPPLKQG